MPRKYKGVSPLIVSTPYETLDIVCYVAQTHTRAHAYIQACTHAFTHKDADTHIHTYIYTHVHVHTHRDTHTPTIMYSGILIV